MIYETLRLGGRIPEGSFGDVVHHRVHTTCTTFVIVRYITGFASADSLV